MHVAHINRLKMLRAAVLSLCGLLVLIIFIEALWLAGVTDRCWQSKKAITATASTTGARESRSSAPQKALTDYKAIWTMDWRRPLVDPPPPKPPPPKPPPEPKPLRVRLLGTVVEPGNSFALLVDGSRKQLLCRLEQVVVDDFRLHRIEPNKVVLSNGLREVTLTVEREE